MPDTAANDILLGLRQIIDEADGPVLPTTERPVGNVLGNEDAAHIFVDYGPGNRYMLLLVRMEEV